VTTRLPKRRSTSVMMLPSTGWLQFGHTRLTQPGQQEKRSESAERGDDAAWEVYLVAACYGYSAFESGGETGDISDNKTAQATLNKRDDASEYWIGQGLGGCIGMSAAFAVLLSDIRCNLRVIACRFVDFRQEILL
jgi:hypothetical protein